MLKSIEKLIGQNPLLFLNKCVGLEVRDLDAIHSFEFTQSLHRVHVLPLRRSLDSVGLAIILLLSFHQRLLLRSFHLPGNSGHIECLHALVLLVLGRRDVRRLDSGHHGIHQVLCCLNEWHGAVQLIRWRRCWRGGGQGKKKKKEKKEQGQLCKVIKAKPD